MNGKETIVTIKELRELCEDIDCNGRKCEECFMFKKECVLAKITGKLLKIEDGLK